VETLDFCPRHPNIDAGSGSQSVWANVISSVGQSVEDLLQIARQPVASAEPTRTPDPEIKTGTNIALVLLALFALFFIFK
jgi:hypothetical protein